MSRKLAEISDKERVGTGSTGKSPPRSYFKLEINKLFAHIFSILR